MGTLKVHLLGGTQLKKVTVLDRQDPYCDLTVGDQTFRSDVAHNGASWPDRHQLFTFKDVTADQVLHIKCYHESLRRMLASMLLDGKELEDPLIGACSVKLDQVTSQGRQELQAPITAQGEYCGTLHFTLEFTPPAQACARAADARGSAPVTQARSVPTGLEHAPTAPTAPTAPWTQGPTISSQSEPAHAPPIHARAMSSEPGHAPTAAFQELTISSKPEPAHAAPIQARAMSSEPGHAAPGPTATPTISSKPVPAGAPHPQACGVSGGCSGPLSHAGSTVPAPPTPAATSLARNLLGRATSEPEPLPPALHLARWLLEHVSQWPDDCLRPGQYKGPLHTCVQHLRVGLDNMWIEPTEVELELGQAGARGGYSAVLLVLLRLALVWPGTWAGCRVALKQFHPFHPNTNGRTLVQSFVREVCMLSQLDHHSIVQLHGFTADLEAGWLGIVLEWVGPSLATLLADGTVETAAPKTRLRWAVSAAEAVKYLHSQAPPIVHRDLTSLNILIGPQGHVKVIDFGISQRLLQTSLTLNRALNHPWMPPEVLCNARRVKDLQVLADCDEKCDVYSVGVILGELATRARPWEGRVGTDVEWEFAHGARLAPPEVLQPWLRQLISQCMSEQPKDRPCMKQVLEVLCAHRAEGIHRSDAAWPVLRPN